MSTKNEHSGGRRRIVVIGAGIVGVCTASYLLRDRHDITLLDPLGPGEGASKGNAGALSPGSCVPLAMPGMFRKIPRWLMDPDGPLSIRPTYLPVALPWLIRFSLAGRAHRISAIADALLALHGQTFSFYEPLVRNARCQHLIKHSGSLVVYESAQGLASSEREWAIRRSRGVRVETLTAHQLRELEPALASRYAHGMLLPDHGFTTNPQRLVRTLAEQFLRDGGRFLKHSAKAIRLTGDGIASVRIENGEITADNVVVAAGIWSRTLVAQLGMRIPLESQRGYHVTLHNPKVEPRLPVSSAEGKYYATPMEEGLRVAGTVEFAGLDAPPNFRRARRLLGLVKKLYPQVETAEFSEWMGHRPCLPDSLPVIGPAPGHPEILFAFGHGHNGMTSAPVTGKIIADLVARRVPPIDLYPYRPDRF